MESGDKRSDRIRWFIACGACIILFILLISTCAVLILRTLEPTVEVMSVMVNIEGGEANVSARFRYSPDVDTKNEELFIRFEDEDVDLNREGSGFWAVLDKAQFREIIENETVRVIGKVEVEPIPSFDLERDVDSRVDLSFLGDILDSVEIGDVDISIRVPSTTVVDFDLTVTMSRDVNIFARNTTAEITAGDRSFEVDLTDLELLSDGTGHGRVEMPTGTLFQLALWGDEVMIDAWGLQTGFEFPVTG